MMYGAGARVSTGCVSTIGVRTVSAARTGCGGGGEEGGGGGPGMPDLRARTALPRAINRVPGGSRQ